MRGFSFLRQFLKAHSTVYAGAIVIAQSTFNRGVSNVEKPVSENSFNPTATLDARNAVLDKALQDITKLYGEEAIQRMGEASHMAIESIATGSISLDIALGIEGDSLRAHRRNLWPGKFR